MNQFVIQIDGGPGEPTKLGGTHSGKRRQDQHWSPPAVSRRQQPGNLRRRRYITPDNQPGPFAPPDLNANGERNIVGHEPASDHFGDDTAQMRQREPDTLTRIGFEQLIAELNNQRRGQARQPHFANIGNDVTVDAGGVGAQRAAFKPGQFATPEPELRSLGNS